MQQPPSMPPKPNNTTVPYWWLPRLFILVMVLFIGGVIGLFVAFACNGGAGGSSQLSESAWTCLKLYFVVFFLVFSKIAINIFSK
jgi:hypothetical protein